MSAPNPVLWGDDAICKVGIVRTMREDDPKPVGALAGHQDGITFIDSKVGAEAGPHSQATERVLSKQTGVATLQAPPLATPG